MKAVLLIDDVDHSRGQRTEADGTHLLTLDGEAVELDLTAEHYKELHDLFAMWLRVGHKPGPAGPAAIKPPAGTTSMGRSRMYLRGLRAWADANGHQDAYRTSTGKWYYPKWLRDAYAQHLTQAGEN